VVKNSENMLGKLNCILSKVTKVGIFQIQFTTHGGVPNHRNILFSMGAFEA
jgi:hypothetical protein